jgi:2-oxoglutarate ferredoxin oxidoreductase subunit gamma
MRLEIRLAGAGGQGLLTAGVILAEAAAIHEGKHVCQTQSYGPEARGGTSRSEIILSEEPIHHPKPRRLDILLAMTQEACDRYYGDLKPDGVLLIDADLVPTPPTSAALSVPITRLAREALGRATYASTAALGALAGATGAVSPQALEAAVLARVPKGTEEANRQAFDLGLQAGREAAAKGRLPEYVADA